MPRRIDAPAGWSARGLILRRQTGKDRAFLRDLYGAFRAEELAPVPWPDAIKAQFLDSQFHLQTLHFERFHPVADFMVIELQGRPIGRLYLDRRPDGFLIVDLGLVPDQQGCGLGTALLRHIRRRAAEAGADRVWLHVSDHNPRARRLYERLGFRPTAGEDATYQRMDWRVS